MDKNQILAFIQEQISNGKITAEDIKGMYSEKKDAQSDIKTSHLINIFYTIGALIVLAGVVLLIGQHWDEIGFGGRMLVTGGIGIAAYGIGLFLRSPEHKVLSQILLAVSAALIPMGVGVFFNEANIKFTFGNQIIVSLGLLCLYTVAYVANKRNILILLNIVWATWLYWAVFLKVLEGEPLVDISKVALIILGIVYLLVAHGVTDNADKERKAVTNILYTLGTLAVFIGGISIGGVFDLVFIAVVFAGFYFSAYIKNTQVLLLSALFLFIHIGKITSKYFTDWFSWPILLIFGGAIVIGIGYFTYYFNKKYIKSA